MARKPENDVYNRQITFGLPISSDNVSVTIPSLSRALQACKTAVSGLLVQSMNMSYQQANNNLYDVTSTTVTKVVGRTQGSIQMNRVIGRASVAEFFYENFGDACNIMDANLQPNSIALDFNQARCSTGPNSADGKAVSYTAYYVVIASTTIGVNANDSIVNEAFQMTMSKLTKSLETC